MGELANMAQKISPFLKIPDNGSVIVTYKGFGMIPDNFNPGKEKVRYTVELNGEDKYFDSGSARVMISFDSVLEGEMVKLTKEVKNNKVRYLVETLAKQEAEVKETKAKK